MDTKSLNQAISLAKQGKKSEANEILQDLVWREPENVQAWFWLADTAATPAERLETLQNGLRQNPRDAALKHAVDSLSSTQRPAQSSVSTFSWNDPPASPVSHSALDLADDELKSLGGPPPEKEEETQSNEEWLQSLRSYSTDPDPVGDSSFAQPEPSLRTEDGDVDSVHDWLAELDTLQQKQAAETSALVEPAPPPKKTELKKKPVGEKPQPAASERPEPEWVAPLKKQEAASTLPMETADYEIHDGAPARRWLIALLLLVLVGVLGAGAVLFWPNVQGWASENIVTPVVGFLNPSPAPTALPSATPLPTATRTITPTVTPTPTATITPLPSATAISAVTRPDVLSLANIQQFKSLASVRARGAVALDARLLAAIDAQTVRIWDFTGEKVRLELKGPTAKIQQAAISPDGKLVAAASEEPAVWVWNAQSGAVVTTLNFSTDLTDAYHTSTFSRTLQVQFSPDGKSVLASSLLGVTWWDVQTRQERHFFPLLATELKTFREQAQNPVGKNATSCLSAFSLDGKILAIGTPFKVYLISWPSGGGLASLATGKPLVEMRWMQNGLLGLAHPGQVAVWDALQSKQLISFASLKTQQANLPPNAGFRLDGKVVAVEVDSARGVPGGLKLVELPSGKTLMTVDPHTDSAVENPQFSLDGRLVFGRSGGDLFVWDAATGKELRRIANRKGFTGMSADGKLFLEVTASDTSLWGVPAGP